MAAKANDLDHAELDEFVAFWAEVDTEAAAHAERLARRRAWLLEMRRKGWPVKVLAERLGVTHQLLYSLLNRAGDSRRPRAKRGDPLPQEEGAHDHRDRRT